MNMKLARLSLISIAGCLAGLIAVIVAATFMISQLNARQQEMQSIVTLEGRTDRFSASSHGLLASPAAPSVWRAYRAEAAALRQRLLEKQDDYPAVRQAIRHIDGIVAALTRVNAEGENGLVRDRTISTQVTEHEVALNHTMSEIGNQQFASIHRHVYWTVGGFTVTALLFGLGCMFALTLLYRRIHGPLRSLTWIASRVEAGHSHIRARPSGDDEFGELARTFNRMLDRQQEDQVRLAERARLLHFAGETARFGGWWVDLHNDFCYWSDMVAEIHGMPPDYSPCVKDAISFYAPEHRQRIRDCFFACVESGTPYDEELQIINAQGERRWVRTIGVPVPDDLGNIVRVEGSFQDITLRHEMSENLQHSLQMRYALIDCLPAHIAVLDNEGNIFDTNDQWRKFGIENDMHDEQLGLGRNYLLVCHNATGSHTKGAGEAEQGLKALLEGERETFSLEYPCHSLTEKRWFRLMARRLESDDNKGAPLGVVVMHIDITERKLAEQQLERLAYEDPLTGLLNRLGFLDVVNRQLHEQNWQAQSAVVVMDIKGQSNINDAHGYQVGDKLLKQIGQRLRERLNSNVVGCINGDAFVFFLSGTDPDILYEQKLNSLLQQPFVIKDTVIEVSARFGFSVLGEERRSSERLLHEAELALFDARRRGVRDWSQYTPHLDQEIHERIELTGDLQRALVDNDLELHFQPKVDLRNGKLIACEALLRWLHPERGMLSPAVFIPVAEQSKLIGPIGEWVLFEACRHLRLWQDAGLEVVRVAVNVSMVQFEMGGLVDQVRHAITVHRIDPGNLILEITESVFAYHSEVLLQQMKELHNLGVRLSLDDFGTGYSSLLYLQSYPFDEIKVDMGFVRNILDDSYSREIVTAVLGISEVLGTETVAEGIESSQIRDMLLGMGCQIGQGYFYSMPLAAEDFQWLLEKRSALPLTAVSTTEDK